MDRNELLGIKTSEKNVCKFVEKYNQAFNFPELNENNLRQELYSAIFSYLDNKQLISAHIPCLNAIRILSRDKTNINDIVREQWINILLYHSGLQAPENILDQSNSKPDYNVIIEALKCLCNLVFNSTAAQKMCCTNGTLEGIIKRLLTYRDPIIPHDVKYFDMKLLFLITALCADVRPKLRESLHGVIYLIETLDVILKEIQEVHGNTLILTDNQVLLSCEVMKVLYNLLVKSQFAVNVDEEEEAHYIRLVILLHDMLLVETQTPSKRAELHGHIVNLLTSLPPSSLKELITPDTGDPSIPKELIYEDYNIQAIQTLLSFMKNRLNNEPNSRSYNELLSPILVVLVMCAQNSRVMRKYLRGQILPPLRDVHRRPEEGSTLRNHLCRLLTSPVTEARDLAAELLFILCKENGNLLLYGHVERMSNERLVKRIYKGERLRGLPVSRMIKYTGYGNAAGLFANRGIMLRGRNDAEAKYSSESEDSDTEEYKQWKHGINDVVGCYEPPKPSPTANMSEEQKEYEAMKLVHLMHDLQQKGVIQPCKLSEDGRPQPVEHILELQDTVQLPRPDSP